MSQLILQPFRRFTYATAHSPTLPLLHLCHSSFSNPSFVPPFTFSLSLTSIFFSSITPPSFCLYNARSFLNILVYSSLHCPSSISSYFLLVYSYIPYILRQTISLSFPSPSSFLFFRTSSSFYIIE